MRPEVHQVRQHWLRDDVWKLRVHLETFGCAFDLPFQALNLSALEDLAADGQVVDMTSNAFSGFEELVEFLMEAPEATAEFILWFGEHRERLASLPPLLSKHLFLTQPCYSGPLSRVLRDCEPWALWEHIQFLKALESLDDKDPQHIHVFRHSCFDVVCELGAFSVPELGALCISWPILPFKRDSRLGDYKTVGEDLVKDFVRCMLGAGMELPMGADNLKRLMNMRSGLTREDLVNRLRMARYALKGLLTLDLQESELLGRTNYQQIAANVAFSSIMMEYRQTEGVSGHQQAISTMEFKLLGTEPDVFDPVPERTLRVESSRSYGSLRVSLLNSWGDLTEGPTSVEHDLTGHLIFKSDIGLNDLEALERWSHLDKTYSWFMDSIQTRRNAHDFETFLVLRTWCVEAFGDIGRLLQDLHTDNHTQPDAFLTGSRIAHRVADAVDADLVSLHYYNRRDSSVDTFGLYHVIPGIGGELLKFFKQELSNMVLSDEKSRRNSIVVRAIDDAVPQTCYSFDPQSRQSNPTDSRVLVLPSGAGQSRSSNAVPINIYGRPWGVVNVGGLRPYQFSSNAATTLVDLANLFGTYIYHHWLLRHIDLMNSAATSPDLTAGQRYFRLCCYLCDVLLADAAVVWVKNLNVEQRFDATTWVNRPDLDELIRQQGLSSPAESRLDRGLFEEDAEDRSATRPVIGHDWPIYFGMRESATPSFSARAIRERHDWLQEQIGNGILSGKWLSKLHTQKLLNLGFKSLCVIPVRFHGEIRACLSLFSKCEQLYDERWGDLMRLVSEEVALMIEAIEMRNILEVNLYMPLRHEIRPDLNSMKERIAKFDRTLRTKSIRNSVDFAKFAHLQSDLDEISSHLSWRVDNIISREDQPIYEYYKDMILVEASQRRDRYKGERVDLRDLYFEIGNSLQSQFDNKRISFLYRGPKRGTYLAVDEITATEILRNIMLNAAKYSVPHDKIFGELREGAHFKFTITSVGDSLKEDEQIGRKIFRRGFRGVTARKKDTQGSGLGLYYVDQLCGFYNISVQHDARKHSKPGFSTHRFTLLFPRNRIRW